jgi:hypothetical protein
MKIRHLWPFALGVITLISMNSCTKTVVQTTVDSVKVIDTVLDKVGLAQVRFVCMFPAYDGQLINIYLPGDSIHQILTAQNICPNTYFDIRPDTLTTLYTRIPSLNNWLDSIPIPSPGPTLRTCAIFLADSIFTPVWSNDSEKFTPPPPGYCYIRLINSAGAIDPLFVDLDIVDSAVVFPHAQSQSIPPYQISEYTLIPVGQHTIYLRVDDPNNPKTVVAFSLGQNFEDGQYYTILAPVVGGLITIDKE